jgi:ComEC/Rec2-related protein
MRPIIVAQNFIATLAGRPLVLLALGLMSGIVLRPGGAALLLLFAVGTALAKKTRWALVAIGIVLGGWRIYVDSYRPPDHISFLEARTRIVDAEVLEIRGNRIWAECSRADGARATGRIQIEDVTLSLAPGQFVRFLVESWRSSEESSYLKRHGILVRAVARRVEKLNEGATWATRWWKLRAYLRSRLSIVMNDEAAAFVGGLLLGLQEDIPSELHQALRDTGTSHLLVVSGMHFVLVYALAGLLARLVFFHRRWWMVAIGWTLLYGMLVVMSVPVMRAIVMIGVHALAHAARRTPDPASVLAAAAIVVLSIDPRDLFDPSFQLSFSAVLALIVFPKTWIPAEASGVVGSLVKASAATSACLLFTAPIVAFHFHQFAPMTVIANLALGPMFTAMMFLGSICLLPGIGWIAGTAAGLLFEVLRATACLFPESSLAVAEPSLGRLVVYGVLLFAWVLVPRAWIQFLGVVALPLVLLFPNPSPESFVIRLDDRSYFIRTEDGETVLLAPGPRTERILSRGGFGRIDWALCTSEHAAPKQAGRVIRVEPGARWRVNEFAIERTERAHIICWRDAVWVFGNVEALPPDARRFGGDIRPDQLPPGASLIQCAPWRTNR